MAARPLAKALHTVTVVTQLARHLLRRESVRSAQTGQLLTADALHILGYEDESIAALNPDPPKLVADCLKAVEAMVKATPEAR